MQTPVRPPVPHQPLIPLIRFSEHFLFVSPHPRPAPYKLPELNLSVGLPGGGSRAQGIAVQRPRAVDVHQGPAKPKCLPAFLQPPGAPAQRRPVLLPRLEQRGGAGSVVQGRVVRGASRGCRGGELGGRQGDPQALEPVQGLGLIQG